MKVSERVGVRRDGGAAALIDELGEQGLTCLL